MIVVVIERISHCANDLSRLDRPGTFRRLPLDLTPILTPLLMQLGDAGLITGGNGAQGERSPREVRPESVWRRR